MRTVLVEHQRDQSFAVYREDDTDGADDSLFSYGYRDPRGNVVTKEAAKAAALAYAEKVAKRIGGKVSAIL